MKILLFTALCYLLIPAIHPHACSHNRNQRNTTRHYFNDLSDRRLLQAEEPGKIRIFVDYSHVNVGGQAEINTIKRVMNITASYFYNILNVTRLPRLYFPPDKDLKCNILSVPLEYVKNGTIGDLGILCANQIDISATHVANSVSCAFLKSNKRPIWGLIKWNNIYLKFDQHGFQDIVFIGIHEMIHVLGFSAALFEDYPLGTPLVHNQSTGEYFLSSPRIQRQIRSHFDCFDAPGIPVEDQDGSLISSHWEKKVMGNQLMIASSRRNSFMSRFTLALLESSGWYESVNYSFAEPMTWGKGEGCNFLHIDNCSFPEFCRGKSFKCDRDGTAIGQCTYHPFAGACKVVVDFINTICIDQNYELKNVNSRFNAHERGGSDSRCFASDFRQQGLVANILNNRCYISVCSYSGRYIFILVGRYVMVCRSEGSVIPAPPGLQGILTCPQATQPFCFSKKTCPFHCNKNGVCINGKCLCTGETVMSPSCVDVSIFKAPVGTTGGLLNSINQGDTGLSEDNLENTQNKTRVEPKPKYIKQYSIDSKCLQGTVLEPTFGMCIFCTNIFNCEECDDYGCISCDDGKNPLNGFCPKK